MKYFITTLFVILNYLLSFGQYTKEDSLYNELFIKIKTENSCMVDADATNGDGMLVAWNLLTDEEKPWTIDFVKGIGNFGVFAMNVRCIMDDIYYVLLKKDSEYYLFPITDTNAIVHYVDNMFQKYENQIPAEQRLRCWTLIFRPASRLIYRYHREKIGVLEYVTTPCE